MEPADRLDEKLSHLRHWVAADSKVAAFQKQGVTVEIKLLLSDDPAEKVAAAIRLSASHAKGPV